MDDKSVVTDKALARARRTSGSGARRPSEIPRRGWVAVAQRVQVEIREDHVSLLAAGVAFKALLALFPALVAAISIWALVGDPATIEAQIEELAAALPSSAGTLLQEQLGNVVTAEAGQLSFALVVSLVIALWSASSGVLGLVEGCNAAYDETDTRSFVVRRGLALALTAGAVVFVVLTLGAIVVLPIVLANVGLGSIATAAIRILQWPALAALTIVSLSMLYRIGPDRRPPHLGWVTWGAVIATVLWLLGSAGFTLYVETFGNYEQTYGAIAGVIVLMLWLYLASFSVLLGAEVNAELERQTAVDTTVGDDRPIGRRGAVAADALPQEYDPEGT